MTDTTLTTEQQRRMEALNNAASLLIDRSTTPANIFNKGEGGSLKAEGLLNAAGDSSHLAQATVTIIDLAEYVISGPEPQEHDIMIDEDGMRVTS